MSNEKNEAIKRLLDRIKKLAENVIDETTGDYQLDAQFLYSVASSFKQKMELDEIDAIKDALQE